MATLIFFFKIVFFYMFIINIVGHLLLLLLYSAHKVSELDKQREEEEKILHNIQETRGIQGWNFIGQFTVLVCSTPISFDECRRAG